MKELRMYKYRLYPSRKQLTRLQTQFSICKEVYNTLLAEEKSILTSRKFDLINVAKDIKITCPQYYSRVHSQVLQNVADRVSKAFDNFFNRIKMQKQGKKTKAGYPRFKSKIHSITYPQYKFEVKKNKIKVSKIGRVPIVLSRPIPGKIKTLTIKQNRAGQWFAVFSCEIEMRETKVPIKSVGIDVGLRKFATLSKKQGNFANPRFFRKSEKKLARCQRILSKKVKGSKNRNKQRIKVARCHLKVFNQRGDFLHKLSSGLAKKYKSISVENLNIQNMLKNHCLAKSISDAGWGRFIQMLSYKAVTCGGQLLKKVPHYTSQTCSGCGKRTKIPLSQIIFKCKYCGLEMDRDENAADIIEDTAGLAEISTPMDIGPLQQPLVVASSMDELGTKCGAG